MAVRTVTSEDVRVNLRDILDDAVAGNEVVIERYRKPTAVVVNYAQWQRQRRLWLAMIDQRLAEMAEGNAVNLDQVEKELQARAA